MDNNIEEYIIFDWQKYVSYYSDLSHIKNKEDAWHHWINFGQKEGRLFMSEKKFTIVYKTYEKDLEWLKYSLLSLQKYLDFNNVNEIIVYTHSIVYQFVHFLLEKINMKEFVPFRIIPVDYDYHGYIKQMTVKANCYKDCKTPYIVILDSDLLLKEKINFNDYFTEDGKINWCYLNVNTNDTSSDIVRVWKKTWEDSNQHPFNIYYMGNHFPFVFTKNSLRDAANKFIEMHGCDYDAYCKNRHDIEGLNINDDIREKFDKLSKVFSEFEYLGFYCHHHSNDYYFSTERHHPFAFIQNWSHGGITEDIKKLLNEVLN
jgi:hypothetical protein